MTSPALGTRAAICTGEMTDRHPRRRELSDRPCADFDGAVEGREGGEEALGSTAHAEDSGVAASGR